MVSTTDLAYGSFSFINDAPFSALPLKDNVVFNISSTAGNFFSALSNTAIILSATLKLSSIILLIGSCIFESKLFNIDDVIVFTSPITFNKLFKLV